MSAETVSTDVLPTSEAAKLLECSSDNVRRLAREGQLRAVIVTRAGRLFARDDVLKLAAERRPRHTPTPEPAA